MGLWVVGVSLCVVASTMATLGIIAMKKSNEYTGCLKILVWGGGLAFMIIGALMDFVAFGFAAQSLIAPLGSVTLICNAVLSPYLLGETVNTIDIVSTFVIAGGCSLSIAFGEHSTKVYTLDQLMGMFNSVAVFIFFGGVVLSVVGFFTSSKYLERIALEQGEALEAFTADVVNVTVPPVNPRNEDSDDELDETEAASLLEAKAMMAAMPDKYHTLHGFGYAYMGGMIGACSVLFGKTVAELVKGIFLSPPDYSGLTSWQLYIIVGAMASTLYGQMKFLNLGLRYHESLLIVPIYQTWWILGGIIGGGTYFQEFSELTTVALICFILGVSITIGGVYMLSYFRKKAEVVRDDNVVGCPEADANDTKNEEGGKKAGKDDNIGRNDDQPKEGSNGGRYDADAESSAAQDTDKLLRRLFERYDVDNSGTINSAEEMQMLTVNLLFHLGMKASADEVNDIIAKLGKINNANGQDVNTYRAWFEQHFGVKL